MGGVRTGLDGRSSLAGLYAAGEVASTGVHGATRLASNSLLEGLVFGARAGRAACNNLRAQSTHASAVKSTKSSSATLAEAASMQSVQETMSRYAGIIRDAAGLRSALQQLDEIGSSVATPDNSASYEARNLKQVGMLVARSALAREESRGAHYRSDFPAHDDAHYLKHTLIRGSDLHFG
jgi:L-aspartate oxidase